MDEAETGLEALRSEVDRIDDQIHDLLMRRSDIVTSIAETKKGTADMVMRPGREAAIMRRILGRHHGPLPRSVVGHVWRVIIASMMRLQGPLQVAVCAPERSVGYWDLARTHYGSATPMTLHRSPNLVLRVVAEGEGRVGVLPTPQEDDRDPWWPSLLTLQESGLKVVAQLPFFDMADARFETLSALVVTTFDVDPTGQDVSLLVLAGDKQISRARLNEHLQAADLAGRCVAVVDAKQAVSDYLHLVEVADYVGADDKRLEILRERAEGAFDRIVRVGGYAVPFRA